MRIALTVRSARWLSGAGALRLGNAQCFIKENSPTRNPVAKRFCGRLDPCEPASFNAELRGGIELNIEACAAQPPQKNPFPSLWDDRC